MSALKPSERSEVSVFNNARVLGEFPLFFLLLTQVCFTLHIWNCGENEPLIFRYGDFLILTRKGSSILFFLNGNWLYSVPMKNILHMVCEGTIVLLPCLIYGHNTKVEFGVFCGPLPVRPTDQAANGILFWAPTKLFSPSSILQEELPDT